LPYDSSGKIYVDCSELAIYHDYISDVITTMLDKNGNINIPGSITMKHFKIRTVGDNWASLQMNDSDWIGLNSETGNINLYKKLNASNGIETTNATLSKNLLVKGTAEFGTKRASQSVKIRDLVEDGTWYIANHVFENIDTSNCRCTFYVKKSIDLTKIAGFFNIRLRITIGTNIYDYDGGGQMGPDYSADVFTNGMFSWEANSIITQSSDRYTLVVRLIPGDCTKVTCKAQLLEFSFHANDDKGLGPTTIDANGNIKLNSGEIRFVNYFAGSDYGRIMYKAWGNEDGYLEIATADDGNEPILVRQYNWGGTGNNFGTIKRTLTLLDKSGNTIIPGNLSVTGEIDAMNIGIRMDFTGPIYRLSASGGNIYLQRTSDKTNKILWSGCKTITHQTNLTGELGTFCESTGKIYDKYEHITHVDCICQVQTATTLNKKIVGIICSEDEFASHGDVYVKVNDINGLEIGDILCPDENGYGRKASETDLMYMMLHAIPRPKITCLDTAFEGYVACFLV
jgi:hypothetical protein